MLRTPALLIFVSVTATLFGSSASVAKPIADIRSISLGDYNNSGCAITTVGALWCFGEIAGGASRDKPGGNRNLPIQVLASDVSAVSVGDSHACAIIKGSLLCWGGNKEGQVGTGKATDFVSVPTEVIANGVTAVSAKGSNTCAIVKGALWCWGNNRVCQIGIGTASGFIENPKQVIAGGVTAVAAGKQHTCAVINGSLKCWGYLGKSGSFEPALAMTEFIASGASAIAAALYTCAIANNSLLCWGRNMFGEVGTGNNSTDNPNVVLSGGITAFSVSEHNTCAIAQGALYCWGSNMYGQLGIGDKGAAHTPLKIFEKGVSAVSVGEFRTCAVVDGILQCTDGSSKTFNAEKTPFTIPEPELPKVEYYGVWRGTIGKQEVMALLGHKFCASSYYYLRYQASISLQGKDMIGLNWTEHTKDSSADWHLEPTGKNKLEGKWTSADGKRSASIKLSRVAIDTASNDSEECSNQVAAYDSPRIEIAMKSLAVINFTDRPLPYRSLSALNHQLSTFEIPPGQFNVPKLNKALRDSLKGELASHYSCFSQAGGTGEYISETEPAGLIARHLLSIHTIHNAYCGGAHPDAWSEFGMWDLETDNAINPSSWIRHDKSPYGGTPPLPEKLIDLIYETVIGSGSADDECNSYLKEYATYSSYSIAENGLIFHIHYPHVIQACDQDITVSYKKLTPFLTSEGKKAAAALK